MNRTTTNQAQERHDLATPDDDGEDYATCDECGTTLESGRIWSGVCDDCAEQSAAHFEHMASLGGE